MTVYAQRHPAHVRSVVLSSAYPLAFDMWARPNARAARRTVHLMCERAKSCNGDKVLTDISHLSTRLRTHPIPYDGRKLDDTALASIIYNTASQAPTAVGDIPAMVRTALKGDTTLLVKAARDQSPMSGSSALAQRDEPFNPGQAVSVMCNDYPTLWNRQAPVNTRLRQFAAKRAALKDRTFWPFGKTAWTSAMNDRGNACIRWPDRTGPKQPSTGFPDVPVLVVSGELDTNTPTEEGRQAARQFPHSTVIEVPNTGHVAEDHDPTGCTSGIETAFIRTRQAPATTCLTKLPAPPVHLATRPSGGDSRYADKE
ncbi:pimeloyl-ACP methyl ester carboxylesterase [Actinomadura rupiterrae]|nr:pimeloyl-ACP methyl ester carboxylesterase [Actinomadura rupiterrae]